MRPMNRKARRVEHLTMKFINDRRAERGLNRLDTDRALVVAAREHSRDMARRGYVGHQSDHHGGPSQRVKKYDAAYESCVQLHGWDKKPYELAAEAVKWWMTSRSHRNGLMRKGGENMGVGIWKDKDKVYFTQLFITRRELTPQNSSWGPGNTDIFGLERIGNAVIKRIPLLSLRIPTFKIAIA